MPEVHKVHEVGHSADDMFDLVADIERYPEFVPLCQSLTIQTEREKGGRLVRIARMTVGYKAVRETFTCQVVLNRAARHIAVSYIDGPFEYMNNDWRFEPAGPQACLVRFDLDYKFRSRALSVLMGSMFDRAFARFVDAFEERARTVYGASSQIA